MSDLPSSPFFLHSRVGGSNRTQSLRVEFNSVRFSAPTEVLANFGVDNTSHFPGAVEMFETCALETFLGEITKDEISFSQRSVVGEFPAFANCEVAQEVLGGVRSERDRNVAFTTRLREPAVAEGSES